jgi:hypothetical protein
MSSVSWYPSSSRLPDRERTLSRGSSAVVAACSISSLARRLALRVNTTATTTTAATTVRIPRAASSSPGSQNSGARVKVARNIWSRYSSWSPDCALARPLPPKTTMVVSPRKDWLALHTCMVDVAWSVVFMLDMQLEPKMSENASAGSELEAPLASSYLLCRRDEKQ